MSLGMTLIRANTLAFGLIGKDGPHGIIKICFGNMNLAFGSEVALLGFWEYMFQILFRVYNCFINDFVVSNYFSAYFEPNLLVTSLHLFFSTCI
jgi:hypothetical protein